MDYDETYTSDPGCMRAVIRCFQSCGHKVFIVTMRSHEHDWDDEFKFLKDNYQVDTIFCDGKAKKPFCESLGLKFQFWMDDKPEGINADSIFTGPELEAWREQNKLIKEQDEILARSIVISEKKLA